VALGAQEFEVQHPGIVSVLQRWLRRLGNF
jgi:hypothetical protein